MKTAKIYIIALLFIMSACGKSEVEDLPINNLEAEYINSVFRIKSVTTLSSYNRIEFEIKKNNISSWNEVERIILKRSMGAQSLINKDSLGLNDLASYPSGPAWVVLYLRDYDLKLSTPSDTFHFIVP